MKKKNILMLLGGMLAATTLFTSCSEEKVYDFDGINYERVYMFCAIPLRNLYEKVNSS
jgi:hypothetical protein